MRLSFAVYTLALLTSACQSTQYIGDEGSPYYPPPTGSTLVLHHELTIPFDSVGVYIQDGRVQSSSQLRRYYPHCKFDLNTRRPEERKVTPDSFAIVKTLQEVAEYNVPGSPRYAQQSFFIKVADTERGGSPLREFTTYMYLQSKNQPAVYRLTCLRWGYPPDDRHLTISEIRHTLGGLFTLEVAKPSA